MDELIKNLRICSGPDCKGCTQKSDDVFCSNKLLHQAADAIEGLSKDLERSKEWEGFWKEEAERALEKLQKYALAIANNPRWIPVTERLPKVYDEVLLQFQCNQAVGFWNGGCWCVHTGNDFYTEAAENEDKPTHWARKFPGPPKEGE